MSTFTFITPDTEKSGSQKIEVDNTTDIQALLVSLGLAIKAHELIMVSAVIDSDMDEIWNARPWGDVFNGNDAKNWFKVEEMDILNRAKVFGSLSFKKTSFEDAVASVDSIDLVHEPISTAAVKRFDALYIANVPVAVRPYIHYKNYISDLINKEMAFEFKFSEDSFTWFNVTTK